MRLGRQGSWLIASGLESNHIGALLPSVGLARTSLLPGIRGSRFAPALPNTSLPQMDQLPPELISVIVSHLDREAIGPYASLSRQWQVAVESITFRHLRLDSTDLNQFQRRLSIQHRRAALETLDYFASLPAYSDDRCAKVERRREREANNAAFTEAVNSLFTILKNWEEDGNHRRRAGRPITLNLCALSPTDIAAPRPYDDMGEHRYERSILTLLDPCSLPQIERVVSFSALSTRAPQYKWSSLGWNLECKPRTLRAASVAQIGSKFPNLTSIKWELEDCAFTEDTIRHKYRKGMSKRADQFHSHHLGLLTSPPQNSPTPSRPSPPNISNASPSGSASPTLKTTPSTSQAAPVPTTATAAVSMNLAPLSTSSSPAPRTSNTAPSPAPSPCLPPSSDPPIRPPPPFHLPHTPASPIKTAIPRLSSP